MQIEIEYEGDDGLDEEILQRIYDMLRGEGEFSE
jgi:hypothetical protein